MIVWMPDRPRYWLANPFDPARSGPVIPNPPLWWDVPAEREPVLLDKRLSGPFLPIGGDYRPQVDCEPGKDCEPKDGQ